MAKVAEARVDITGKDKTKQAFTAVQGRLKRLKSSLVSVKGAMTLLIGAGFVTMGKSALASADAIGKFSDRAGVTTSQLQKMRFAFDLAGVGVEAVDKAFLTFGKRLGKAHQGIGALAGGLKGGEEALLEQLKATDSTSEALDVMFKAMGAAETQTRKLAIADAAFGMAGLRMTAAFRDGSKAFFDAKKEAEALGIVLDEKLIRNAELMNDQMTAVSSVLKTKMMAIFIKLAPLVDKVATGLLNIAKLAEAIAPPVVDSTDKINKFKDAIAATNKQIEFLKKQHGGKILGIWPIDHLDQLDFLRAKVRKFRIEIESLERKQSHKEDRKRMDALFGRKPPTAFTDKGAGWGLDETIVGVSPTKKDPFNVDVVNAQHKALSRMVTARQRSVALLRAEVLHGQKKIPLLQMENDLRDVGGDLLKEETDIYKNKLTLLIEEQQKLNDQLILQNRITSAAEAVFDRWGDGIIRAMQRGEDAMESFKNVSMAALFDIGREMMKLMVFDPLKEAVSPVLKGLARSIGSAIGGSFFGGGGGSSMPTEMAFAHGGFAHAGKPALVGERGAEIFMPRVGGQIIPNDQLGGGGVNVTFNLSTGVQSTVRAEVMGMMPIITANVKGAVAEARQRGGSFSEAMGV